MQVENVMAKSVNITITLLWTCHLMETDHKASHNWIKTGGGDEKGNFCIFKKSYRLMAKNQSDCIFFWRASTFLFSRCLNRTLLKKTWHAELKPAHAPAGKVLNSSSRNFYVFPFNKSKKGQAELDSVPRCIK